MGRASRQKEFGGRVLKRLLWSLTRNTLGGVQEMGTDSVSISSPRERLGCLVCVFVCFYLNPYSLFISHIITLLEAEEPRERGGQI